MEDPMQPHGPQDRGPAVLIVTALMLGVSFLFLTLRMISRGYIVKRFLLDDWLMVAAWLVTFGLSFAVCYGTTLGLGRHRPDIPNENVAPLAKAQYAFTVLYNPALMLLKSSILTFFLTLAKEQRVFKWTTIGTLVVVNVFGLALTFISTFQCRPMSSIFTFPKPEDSKCTDIITLYISSAPLNIITDLIMVLLPLPVLKSMRLPKKQKIIVFITFGFGIFVTAVDVVRISSLTEASRTRLNEVVGGDKGPTPVLRSNEDYDFSWYAALSFMWSAIECNVGIMVGCVPALKPLASRCVPQMIRDKSMSGPSRNRNTDSPTTSELAFSQRMPSIGAASKLEPGQDSPSQSNADEREMSFTEFLATPDLADMPTRMHRTDTMLTNNTNATIYQDTYFDFVHFNSEKSIVLLTVRESIMPIVKVTGLFLLWGVAYGLLNSLNAQFQLVARFSAYQTIGLHSAYYGGYLIAPLTFGRIILKRYGFKACFMAGLMIYGTGTLVFWPAGVLTSFAAYFVSNFIVGMGLSTLEIAANPFIALCGPREWSEVRLNLSQGVQAIGTVVSPLLASKALFKNATDADSLIDVQWTYLAISLFTFVLAFVYYCISLGEVTDEELERAAWRSNPKHLDSLRSSNTIWYTLALSAFAQFWYVGAQETIAGTIDTYILEYCPGADPVNWEAIAHAVFAASRFIAAFEGLFFHARHQLCFYTAGSIIFAALAMKSFDGVTAGAILIMAYFFEGPIFSFIYAMPLHGLGRHTKDGSAILTASVSGGAILPLIYHTVQLKHGTRYAFCVIVAGFAAVALLPLYFNLVPLAKKQVDYTATEEEVEQGVPPTRFRRGISVIKGWLIYCNPNTRRQRREERLREVAERSNSTASSAISPTTEVKAPQAAHLAQLDTSILDRLPDAEQPFGKSQ